MLNNEDMSHEEAQLRIALDSVSRIVLEYPHEMLPCYARYGQCCCDPLL